MDVRLPDGTVIKGVPDGTTKADLVAKMQRNGMAVPSEWLEAKPAEPAAASVGKGLMQVPRQLGLAARYGIEGLGNAAEIVTEPIRQFVVNPLLKAAQPAGVSDLIAGKGPTTAASTGKAASSLADLIGLPKPETADERVIGDASRLVAGGGGMVGAARGIAGLTGGVTRTVANTLAANPAQQLAGAAAAGGAGGSVREAGGGEGAQFAAALGGGLAAPVAMSGLQSLGSRLVQAIKPSMSTQQIDLVLKTELGKAGVSWDDIGAAAKQQIRNDAKAAVYSGQPLQSDALARLADFRRIGATPMVGDITQDPTLLTQQRNLAKQLANSRTPVLGGDLPSIQNENAKKVISTLTSKASSPLDEYATGQGAIDTVRGTDERANAAIGGLYDAARDSGGRSASLDGATFTRRANELLQQNLAPKLGAEVDTLLNDIATGKTPLTVEFAEQLKTLLGRKAAAAKSTQGDLSYAYGLVRRALDETPLSGSAPVNPGNLPAVAGTVPASTAVGQESIDAFNAARQAAKARFQWKESAPFIEDALSGMEPDKFVRKHVIGADVANLQKLKTELKGDPQTMAGVKKQLLDYILKRGSVDEGHTSFTSKGLEDGLKAVGERKLALFFNEQEIADIKAAVAVGRHMQAQPIGSAVNNSNSGALLLAKFSDALGKMAGVPVIGPMVSEPLQTLTLRAQTVPLRNLSSGLVAPAARQKTPVSPLGLLLAAPSAQGREDKN
jgi:hypothetical protein